MTEKMLASLILLSPFAALALAFLIHEFAVIAARLRVEWVAISARAERERRR